MQALDPSGGDGRVGQYMEEYKILRSEITHYMERDDAMCRQMYMAVAALLSLAEALGDRGICLAAFCIIVPVSYKLVYSKECMAKLSSYMHCFLEGQIPGFCWESRLYSLRHGEGRTPKPRLRFHNMECISMAVLCSAVYLLMPFSGACTGGGTLGAFRDAGTLVQVFPPVILSLWVFFITLKRDKFSNFQSDWENRWENLKKEEVTNEKHK